MLAVQALHEFSSPTLEVHHVSTVDGTGLADVLDRISAGETLFIVCSKTFSTWETSLNAVAARTWLVTQLGAAAIARHFVGVSANPRAMDAFGIEEGLRFRVWEWVGGGIPSGHPWGWCWPWPWAATTFGHFWRVDGPWTNTFAAPPGRQSAGAAGADRRLEPEFSRHHQSGRSALRRTVAALASLSPATGDGE